MKIIAHNLFDSAGTFGFQPVSEAATPLDRLLTDLEQDCQGSAVDEKNLNQLRFMITEVIASVDESLTNQKQLVGLGSPAIRAATLAGLSGNSVIR